MPRARREQISLAETLINAVSLWTRDQRLAAVIGEFGLG